MLKKLADRLRSQPFRAGLKGKKPFDKVCGRFDWLKLALGNQANVGTFSFDTVFVALGVFGCFEIVQRWQGIASGAPK